MKKIAFFVLLLVVGGYAYYRYYITTPRYSLGMAYVAMQSHEPDAFNQYFDTESVAQHLLDEATQQRGLLSLINPGSWAMKGLGAMAKPALAAGVKQQVDTYIRTGSAQEAMKAGNAGSGMIAGMLGKLVSDSAEFKGVAFENKLPNGTAEVGLEFTQPRYDTTMIIRLQMLDKGDHWQVTQIANAGELIRHISNLESERLLGRLRGKKD